MSYRTIGYIEGRPIKVDEGSAYGVSSRLGGELVVGGPGPNDRDMIAKAQARNNAKRRKP